MNQPPRQPAVLFWYRIYAILMTLLYAGMVALAVLMAFFNFLHEEYQEILQVLPYFYFIFLYGLSAILGTAFAVSFFLPRKPWAWTYHLCLICLGLTSPCCLPISIPLMIFWFKKDTLAYFEKATL